MNTRGLPGTLAPRYHELHDGNSVKSAIVFTYATHASWASGVASMRRWPLSRR